MIFQGKKLFAYNIVYALYPMCVEYGGTCTLQSVNPELNCKNPAWGSAVFLETTTYTTLHYNQVFKFTSTQCSAPLN